MRSKLTGEAGPGVLFLHRSLCSVRCVPVTLVGGLARAGSQNHTVTDTARNNTLTAHPGARHLGEAKGEAERARAGSDEHGVRVGGLECGWKKYKSSHYVTHVTKEARALEPRLPCRSRGIAMAAHMIITAGLSMTGLAIGTPECARFIEALQGTDFQFTTQLGEPSLVYTWTDMIVAATEMCNTGVAGGTLYAGPRDDPSSARYGLANLAAFLANSMQETIQYDACDENNWSDKATQQKTGGADYPATAACGQLGQSYQDYHCTETIDPDTGQPVDPKELECEVDPEMIAVAETHATWYGAPPPLFCAPKSKMPEAPRWNYDGWCPSSSKVYGQEAAWDLPFGQMPPKDIYFGGHHGGVQHVPPEVLEKTPTYIDYVRNAVDKGASTAAMLNGEGCLDLYNQRAGFWESCVGGCANTDAAHAIQGAPRTDVEGCCWWGRGVIQTTGVCNFGKLNYFLGAKAARRGKAASYPTVQRRDASSNQPGRARCLPRRPTMWLQVSPP